MMLWVSEKETEPSSVHPHSEPSPDEWGMNQQKPQGSSEALREALHILRDGTALAA